MKHNMYKYGSLIVGIVGAALFMISHHGITSQFYLGWVKASKELPAGDTVSRDEASIALKKMSMDNADYAERQMYPVILMMVGFLNYSGAQRKVAEQGGASDR